MVKKKSLCTVGGNVNCYRHYGKHYEDSQKLKIELPYHLAIPLLGIYLNEVDYLSESDIYIPMFIAALFTITKAWKQPKCPLMNECIKKIWFIYTMEYFPAMRKNSCHLRQHRWTWWALC